MMPPRPSRADVQRGREYLKPSPEAPPARRLRLVSFKPLVKGALRGFATVELPIGLTLIDCPVLVGRHGPWVNLPARQQIDKDGRPMVGADGRPAYAATVAWRDRDLANRFSAAVATLVRAEHPDALDGPGGP